MKIINKAICAVFAASILMACSENVNDWPVEQGYDRLYRTTHFELEEMQPTAVTLKFNGISDATKYIFEFSLGDSMKFSNIVRTEEVMADTLTPYSEGKVIVQNEYKKLFEDLNGTTLYSVRVKGVNEQTGTESGWFGLSFKTPAEQIFTGAVPGIIDASVNWESDKTATTIKLGSVAKGDTTWISTSTLTDTQKRNGEASFSGLNPGTNYVAQIFNGEFIRGTYGFTTLGSATGQTIDVQPGDNIGELLAAATDETVTLVFTGGQDYDIGSVSVPANIKNLYFSGTLVNGTRAHLHIPSFGLQGPVEDLHFQYVEVDAVGSFWMVLGGVNAFNRLFITGSIFRHLNNCIVRAYGDVEIEGIYVNNSWLDHVSTGGWGVFNIAGNTKMHYLSITNTTITDVADQLMDIRVELDQLTLEKITFCNYEVGLPKLILAQKKPKEALVSSCIFAGDNNGQKINHGWGDYSAWLDFSGSYITSDLVENNRPFVNITHLDMTSEELFVDPRHGDFHVKDDVQFRGKGKVGDPRWW